MMWSRTGLAFSRTASASALVAALCALACGLAVLAAAPALATTTYPALSGHFGSPGSGEGQLSDPTGIAVNQSTGNVYVSDAGNNRIEEFGPTGAYVGQFDGSASPTGALVSPGGIAVDNSGNPLDPANGDVYVIDSGKQVTPEGLPIYQFTSSGEYVGEIVEVQGKGLKWAQGLAVDPAGNLWVETYTEAIEFSDTGSFERRFKVSGTNTRPGGGLAVDANDSVYVLDGNEGRPVKFSVDGEQEGQFAKLTDTSALALNQHSNSLFIDEGDRVVEYGPYGENLFGKNASEQPLQTFAQELSESEGIALNPGPEGRFYATEKKADEVEIYDAVIEPTVTPSSAAAVAETTATLGGTVDPEGLPVTSCQLEYGTSETYGQSVPCEQAPGEGYAPVAVSAQLTALAPNTLYHFRVSAANAKFGEAHSVDATFITRGPLQVLDESVANVASSSATLDAEVNPAHDIPTTYYFQYGTSEAYGTDIPAPPGAVLRSGEGELEASEHLQGLQADTVYHYRFVGISEQEPGVFETTAGPDRTFTTQGVQEPGLPDGRQWELVSPADKHGALIEEYESEGGVIQAAVGGEAFSYLVNAPTESQPPGYTNRVQVLSLRGPDGWSSRDISTPHEVPTGASIGHGQEYRFFSEDLSLGVVQPSGSFIPASSPFALAPSEASEQTAFLRTDFLEGNVGDPCLSGCYRPLVTGLAGHENVPPGTVFGQIGNQEGKACPPEVECGPNFVGASPDAHHVILRSSSLTSTPATGGDVELYEWSAGVPQAESLSMVSVLPNGEGGHGAELGNVDEKDARGAVSDDGSRVFFSEAGHLYARLNATRSQSPLGSKGECAPAGGACTLQLDLVKSGAGTGTASAEFQVASRDGSRAFFTDTQALTGESSSSREGRDLYECEIVEVAGEAQCRLSDLTPLHGGESADVLGTVPGASNDGGWIYFIANGKLGVPGAAHGTCSAAGTANETCNLFVVHEGEAPRLVAVLSGADAADWGSLESLTARVSPSGRWLAFASQRELTGYDTRDALSGQPDGEVYLYDAQSERISCASCDPTGARPVSAAVIPSWTPYRLGESRYQPPYLSDSGRLFFTSKDPLVAQDVNGTADVYEYEAPGAGGASGCTSSLQTFSPISGGCVNLISSGGSAEPSTYLGSSESGDDVFFLTTAKLVPQDFDASLDVYDAHECRTGSPCFPAPVAQPPACTTADACRAAPTPQPSIFGAPASSTFSGAGNVAPPAAGSGKSEPKSSTATRAQKLARALRVCARQKQHRRRVTCERRARKRYGPARHSVKKRAAVTKRRANANKRSRG